MAAKTFENYLYKRHKAVFASPLMTNLRLLDVLIKTDSHGLLPSRPVLQKVGNMLNLGIRGEEFDITLARLREGLESFERTGEGAEEEKDLFKWNSSVPHIDVNIRSAASITGTLLGGLADANLHLKNANGVNCCLRYLEIACVDKTELLEIMLEPQWKPDITKRALKWPQPGCISNRSGLHELWIVYEILYATNLIVKSADSTSAGGGVHSNLGQSSSVVTGPGGSLRVSQTAAGSFEAHAAAPGQKFMFAFRAMCFQFDAEGEVVEPELDAGRVTPVYREREGESVYDDPRLQLGGLFLNPPPDPDDAEIELQRLEIQISPDAEP